MALSQRVRASIYRGLHEVIGEEEVEELLAQFPSRDVDEPLRREHLAVHSAQIEARLAGMDARMAEMDVRMAEMDARLAALIDTRTRELDARIGQLDARMSGLEARMADRFRAQTTLMVTLIAAGTAITSTVSALVA